MLRFNRIYFLLAFLLFFIELYIALYVHDAFVRPYVGDLLVVILIYCLVRSFLNTKAPKTIWCVLVFAYLIELSQYLGLIKYLGLGHSRLANLVLGNSFEWIDIVAYTLGALLVWLVEIFAAKKRRQQAICDIEL